MFDRDPTRMKGLLPVIRSLEGSAPQLGRVAWIVVAPPEETPPADVQSHSSAARSSTERALSKAGFLDPCHDPHQSLANNSPQPRLVEPPPRGRIIAMPQVGGLHHRYRRVA
jgi:hypothetical protein